MPGSLPATLLPAWDNVHRIIPSHFPPINLFESILDPEEYDIAFVLESMTNDRLRDEVGDLQLVPVEVRLSGPGSTPVMASFTHTGYPSRFTDGLYGVYYGSKTLRTAITETVHHREFFLRDTHTPDAEFTMRVYLNKIALPLHDIRSAKYNDLHQADDYTTSQTFAKKLIKMTQSNGLLYRSVRDPGGECIAAFKPITVTATIQGQHLRYVWCGQKQRIVDILEVSELSY
jgi:hypothetical protein